MDRLETRVLAYFVTVAEELHFGRAASRLGMAQPPLSRAIRQLERRLGVVLLHRGSRRVELTVAGEVLLAEARVALAAVDAAAARTRRAGASRPKLVLVTKPGLDGGLLPDIVAAFEREPDVPVVDVQCSLREREAMLLDGRADVGLLHLPHDDLTGLDSEPLLVVGQVLVVAKTHRLAGQEAVRLADLRGEVLPRRRGTPARHPDSPEVQDAGQLLQLVALGRAVALLPASALGHVRQDLVGVPVVDADPVTIVVAWPAESRSPAVAAFVRAASAVAAAAKPVGSPPSPPWSTTDGARSTR